jgi:nitroreductase
MDPAAARSARGPRRPAADALFLDRWSPRAMSGEVLAEEEILRLLEAAAWAPSSFNNQPWRFLYARRDGPRWAEFLGLLTESNRSWAKNAAALFVIVSKTTFDHNGRPSRTHSFDAGAAWENLALQGSRDGLVVHGMEGFDYEKARALLAVPDGYAVEAMAAVGRPGRKKTCLRPFRSASVLPAASLFPRSPGKGGSPPPESPAPRRPRPAGARSGGCSGAGPRHGLRHRPEGPGARRKLKRNLSAMRMRNRPPGPSGLFSKSLLPEGGDGW